MWIFGTRFVAPASPSTTYACFRFVLLSYPLFYTSYKCLLVPYCKYKPLLSFVVSVLACLSDNRKDVCTYLTVTSRIQSWRQNGQNGQDGALRGQIMGSIIRNNRTPSGGSRSPGRGFCFGRETRTAAAPISGPSTQASKRWWNQPSQQVLVSRFASG